MSDNGKFLTREDIQARQRDSWQELEVPEWKGKVLIRPLSVRVAMEVMDSGGDKLDGAEALAAYTKIAAAGVVQENGEPLFTIEQLEAEPLSVLEIVGQAVLDLSGMGDDEEPGKN